MTLKITGIRDGGDLEKERVVIVAQAAAELAQFAFLKVGNKTDPTVNGFVIDGGYWFPSQAVKVNDLVILYTKSGEAKQKENVNGTTSYFYYLGHSEPAWGDLPFLTIARVTNWENYSTLMHHQAEEEGG